MRRPCAPSAKPGCRWLVALSKLCLHAQQFIARNKTCEAKAMLHCPASSVEPLLLASPTSLFLGSHLPQIPTETWHWCQIGILGSACILAGVQARDADVLSPALRGSKRLGLDPPKRCLCSSSFWLLCGCHRGRRGSAQEKAAVHQQTKALKGRPCP